MSDDLYVNNPQSGLYPWFRVAYFIWSLVTGFALILDIGNGLNNFLHAPIGIKDNLPEPAPIIALAQELLISIVVIFVVLRFLCWLSKVCGTFEVVSFLAGIATFVVFISAMLKQSRWHLEFIPGSIVMFRWGSIIFGYALPLGFLTLDGYLAVSHLKAWFDKERPLQGSNWSAGLLFTGSTVFGAVSFVAYFVHWFTVCGYCFFAALALGFIGLSQASTGEKSYKDGRVEGRGSGR